MSEKERWGRARDGNKEGKGEIEGEKRRRGRVGREGGNFLKLYSF